MICEHLDKSVKPCKYYAGENKCSEFYYYCPISLEKSDFNIHQSQIKDFDRCPYKFYLSYIEGLETKPEYQSIAIRRGSYLHSLLSRQPEDIYFSEEEKLEQYSTEIIYKKMIDLELLPDIEDYEKEYINKGVKGVIDFIFNDSFGEFKYTSQPEFYLNSFLAHYQLSFYFFISGFTYAYMLPIRVPQLKYDERKENKEEYLERLEQDILRRPNFYFPEYNKERTPPKWGRRFWINEFDLDELERKANWTKKEIKDCLANNYFPQRFANCLFPTPCDFMPICETGNINEEVFVKKTTT